MVDNCPENSTLELSDSLGGGQLQEAAHQTITARENADVQLADDKDKAQKEADDRGAIRETALLQQKVDNLTTLRNLYKADSVEYLALEQERLLAAEALDENEQNNRLRGFKNKQKIDEDEKKRVEELLKLKREVLKAEEDLEAFRQEQQRKTLTNDLDNSFGQQRLVALQKLRDFDVAEIVRQNDARQEQMQADIDTAFAKVELEKTTTEQKEQEKAQIIALYQAQALQSEEEFQAQKKAIEDKYIQERHDTASEQFGGGMFGDLIGSISVMADSTISGADKINSALTGIGQSFTSLNQVAGGAINNMLSGIGSMIQSYILLGNSGGNSLRKLTAQVLASIASQAAVLAIFETAKGLAALFFAPEEAAAHFGAAILFGSIAGITAALARGIAGDSFKQTASKQATAQSTNGISGGSSGTSGSQSPSGSSGNSRNGGAYYSSHTDTNTREENRQRTIDSQGKQVIELRIKHDFEPNQGKLLKSVTDSIKHYGEVHGAVLQVVHDN